MSNLLRTAEVQGKAEGKFAGRVKRKALKISYFSRTEQTLGDYAAIHKKPGKWVEPWLNRRGDMALEIKTRGTVSRATYRKILTLLDSGCQGRWINYLSYSSKG
jgi:hypothetical protein